VVLGLFLLAFSVKMKSKCKWCFFVSLIGSVIFFGSGIVVYIQYKRKLKRLNDKVL